MTDPPEADELRAALRECVCGYSDLLAVARSLLAHVEEQIPLPPDSITLHQSKFDTVEAQVRQLQAMLDMYVAPPSERLH